MAARRSYDVLKSARARRETWRPDRIDIVEAGGEPALLVHREGRVHYVDTVQIKDGLITEYRRVLNPEKLAHL
ncbi:hypothetical protein [Streptomyces sp. NPDC001070]